MDVMTVWHENGLWVETAAPLYQVQLAHNKYAQMALDIGWKHKLGTERIHELGRYLSEVEAKHDQHLHQLGVTWARGLAKCKK